MPAQSRVLRPRHASRPVHRRVLRTIGSATAAIMGFVLVSGAAYLQLTLNAFEKHDVSSLLGPAPDSTAEPKEDIPTDFAAGNPINIALIGTDERNDENGVIGGSGAKGMRGDTTMVMHISADRSRIEVVSIPRDSRVRISDCMMYDGTVVSGWTTKFNEALSSGGRNGNRGEGAACVMRTITDLTGVDFNGHFMMVDFSGFKNMVNSLGGIPMCIPNDMRSPKAKLDLKAGPQTLDGKTALAFARARTGYGLGDGSDLMRIDRQQDLMTNTIRKALGMNLLTDVPQLTQFVRSGAESLTLDNQLASVTNIVGLAYSLRNFDTANLTFVTVPWEYPGDKSGDVVWSEPEATAMWQSIVDDVPLVHPDNDKPEPSTTTSPTMSPTPSVVTTPDSNLTREPVRESDDDILAGCEV